VIKTLLKDDAGEEPEKDHVDRFDDDARVSIHDIREDLGRQLDLVSDRQNAMITIVGILVAFASLLFITIYPEEGFFNSSVGLDSYSAIAFGICCAVGITTLLFWKNWDFGLDGNIKEAISRFNEDRWFSVQTELLSGLFDSYDEMCDKNHALSQRIKIMVLIIMTGLITMVIGRL